MLLGICCNRGTLPRWRPVLVLILSLCPFATLPAAPFSSGIPGEVWTLDREALSLDGIKIRSDGPGVDGSAPSAAIHFHASPTPPAFETIQKIVLVKTDTQWIGSRPDSMEYYWLGAVTDPVPPPPDWKRQCGQIPPWKQAIATDNTASLPFLNNAVFCWAGADHDDHQHGGVYIFRQGFQLDRPERVMRAVLRLASNTESVEVALNEQPLHLGSRQAAAIAEYEIGPMLRQGKNIIAMNMRHKPATPDVQYGLAFHIELTLRPEGRDRPPDEAAGSLALGRNGDRVWGKILQLKNDGVLLQTKYGEYQLAWTDCAGLLLPRPWSSPQQSGRNGLWRGGQSTAADTQGQPASSMADIGSLADQPQFTGLPIAFKPPQSQDCLLLSEGRIIAAKPAGLEGSKFKYVGSSGDAFSIGINELQAIYPSETISWEFKRPKDAVALLACQAETLSGERISGLLRELNGRRLILQLEEGNLLTIDAGELTAIRFPYHGKPADELETMAGIGILGQVSGQESSHAAWLADVHQVQQAAFAIKAKCEPMVVGKKADLLNLKPQTYPVIVSVDPLGEYLQTVEERGDAQTALLQYVEGGGRLIALSRGGAFRTAIVYNQGLAERVAPGQGGAQPDLMESLGLRIVRGGDHEIQGVIPFDHPPNTAEQLFFQRQGELPQGLQVLPRRIMVAPLVSAPFFPMIGQAGQGIPLYQLYDAKGTVYGGGLTLFSKGQGWILIIDHLLWESRVDDRPFGESVLPGILRWSLEKGHQTHK